MQKYDRLTKDNLPDRVALNSQNKEITYTWKDFETDVATGASIYEMAKKTKTTWRTMREWVRTYKNQ